MVRLARVDLERAVELFEQHNAEDLVGEGHFRKAEPQFRTVEDFLRKSVRAAYDESKAALATEEPAFELFRKLS